MTALDARSQRTAFSDVVAPPPGYRLDACIGTTYSLDFEAFTALLLAFVGAEVEHPEQDPGAMLTTLAGLRDRLRVYVNAGSLHVPGTAHRLFGRYDRLLMPVRLEGAAFHPKVWVMKFAPIRRPERHRDQPIYRVLTASRNATATANWELGVALDGRLGGAANGFSSSLKGFCDAVTSRSRRLPRAVRDLVAELPRVVFDGGREGAESLRFEWQWPGRTLLRTALPKKAARAIVLSPFVRGAFIERLCSTVDDLIVVSTQDELDALPDSAHERLAAARVFVVSGQGDDEVKALDLHAKLLAWQSGQERETLIGSANATTVAWGLAGSGNCEAMVALRPGLRVDEVYRAFVSPEKGKYHGWIEPYTRTQEPPSDEEEARREIDALCRQLACDALTGTYDRQREVLRVRGDASARSRSNPEQLTVELVPLLQQQTATWQPYDGVHRGLSFPNVPLHELSSFVVVRARHCLVRGVEKSFCAQVALDLDEQTWEDRDNAMNTRLLENVDARTVLLNVLLGRPAGTGAATPGSGGGTSNGSLLERVTIERVLETCTADPSRVPQVDAVLRACRDVPELEAFREFWDNFSIALRREERADG